MRRKASLAVPVIASLTLAGCASSGDEHPSLAIRDAERIQGTFDVAPAPTPAPSEQPVGTDTLDRIVFLTAQAAEAHADFLAAAPGAGEAVTAARGADVTENRWAIAQVALADLDSARSRVAIALGDLDLLYTEATLSFTDRNQVDAARSEVVALVAEEDRVLAQLRGALAR